MSRALVLFLIFVLSAACGTEDRVDPPQGGGSGGAGAAGGSGGSGGAGGAGGAGGTAGSGGAGGSTETPVGHVVVDLHPDYSCVGNCFVLRAGDERFLVARVYDEKGGRLPDAAVEWVSGNGAVASVDDEGVVRGLAPGLVDIEAHAGGKVGSVALQVQSARIERVEIEPAVVAVEPGATVQLAARAFDRNGNEIDGVSFAWTVSNPYVASVDESGLVTGTAAGSVVVQAGNDDTFRAGAARVDVGDLAAIPAGLVLDHLAISGAHGCGVAADGVTHCWGWNYFGQLGDGTVGSAEDIFPTPAPVLTDRTFTRVATGMYQSCALEADGKAWCWGLNDMGQLGTHEEVGEVGGTVIPYEVLGEHRFASLAMGAFHTCGLIVPGAGEMDSPPYCWGSHFEGQLGLGDTGAQHAATPTPLGGSHRFVQLVGGLNATCGLTAAGEALCWGSNMAGQLGSGQPWVESEVAFAPQPVQTEVRFTKLDMTGTHVCGITAAGAVHCWGNNAFGQVGLEPSPGVGAPVEVALGIVAVDIATGAHHTCALADTGGVTCWGDNMSGQLGVGHIGEVEGPAEVETHLAFTSIETGGNNNTCARTAASETYCWGSGFTGESGWGFGGGPALSAIPWPVAQPGTPVPTF